MRTFLSLAAVGLLATGALAATPNSFQAWENEFPSCSHSCIDTYYNTEIGNSCGSGAKSSTQASDLACICTKTGTVDQVTQAANSLGTCVAQQCASATDVSAFSTALNDLIPMCQAAVEGKGSSTSTSSAASPSSSSTSTAASGMFSLP